MRELLGLDTPVTPGLGRAGIHQAIQLEKRARSLSNNPYVGAGDGASEVIQVKVSSDDSLMSRLSSGLSL